MDEREGPSPASNGHAHSHSASLSLSSPAPPPPSDTRPPPPAAAAAPTPTFSPPPPLAPPLPLSNSNHYSNHSDQDQDGARGEAGGESKRVRELDEELVRTRREKEALEAQYTNLLGKLTTMRATVGDKLKQDADELDRREQEISDLRAANDDLALTVDTLKSELVQSHDDADHVHSELEQLRLRAFDSQRQTTDEASSRETALRDAQDDLERVRLEREEWEDEAMRERVRREELEDRVGQLEIELAAVKTDREVLREDRDREAESAANLHAVLEEFQAAKERELKATLGDLQAQLRGANDALVDFKRRATDAENKLQAAQNDSEKLLALTKEVKDKTLVVGKLRHEAIIMNEHLTEALRRLKKDSNENSVDRQLVSNVLIAFLNTPRADTKRFEMLQLISSILSWSDDQREQVGLQRSSGLLSAPGVIGGGGSRPGKGHARSGKGKGVDDGLGESENFGQLWVEFLLKESNAAAASKQSASSSSSTTPSSTSTTPTLRASSSSSAPSSPNSASGSLSPRLFNLNDLPPILSPPLISPTASGTSTRRPSFTSFLRGDTGGRAGTPPSIQEEAEERK
ncbi:hypothetical protein RQP46_000978 [Phenoliferia psychrophenolica]